MGRIDHRSRASSQVPEKWDAVVIGSGFGGSVSAMRLAEKGYRVLVIEKGRRWKDEELPKSNWKLNKYFWAPWLNWLGIQKIDLFRQVFVMSGTGVGGGSLVYANTHMMPKDGFFRHPSWSHLADWKQTLMPFYEKAKFMLGTSPYKKLHPEDRALMDIARELGREDQFGFVDGIGVNLSGEKDTDPYFGGLGPVRQPCKECAACMVGCRHNAKNTLEKNYLWFAEQYGAEILPETEVWKVEPEGKGYRVFLRAASPWKRTGHTTIETEQIIISGGVLGTLNLLFRQRDRYGTLPYISRHLGGQLRTNSEMLAGVTATREKVNHGVAISTVFHPDDKTTVELCKYPDGSGLMNFLGGPAVPGLSPWRRTLHMMWTLFRHPLRTSRILFQRDRARNTIYLLVMQGLDNAMHMSWRRSWWGGGKLVLKNTGNEKVPAFIPEGQAVNEQLAQRLGGLPLNSLPEVVLGTPSTAHILGGCPMGSTIDEGVVNADLELHGYPGIRIIDGSVIQANLGVNPSLTITALAEYAMSRIPSKPGNTHVPLDEKLKSISQDVSK